ncbi:MAG: cupredoxin domain-containing protein [Armatimonadota bacterium]|nr:cupredoxin domain-containing protein [Armatimonadota bacterium]
MRTVVILGIALALAAIGPAAGAPKAQKVTVVLNEMSFTPSRVTVTAGTPVELVLVNRGKQKHEFMVYSLPRAGLAGEELEEWAKENTYFKGVEVTVETAGVEIGAEALMEVELAPGRSVTLEFTPQRKGTFEIGCHVEGHYEAGMKGTFVVR